MSEVAIIRSRSLRLLRVSLILVTALASVSCETVERSGGPISSVERADTLQAAKKVRGRVGGGGYSMAPIYGSNTLIVTAPIAFEELKIGMIVAYRSRSGNRYVHQLIQKKHRNWVAKGLNNPTRDPELVTPENLIGVVYAIFNSQSVM